VNAAADSGKDKGVSLQVFELLAMAADSFKMDGNYQILDVIGQ
jgi:hypothetical protein